MAPVISTIANLGGLGFGALLAGIFAQWAGDPLRLIWMIDLGLVVANLLALPLVEETAPMTGGRLRLQRLSLPPEVRRDFVGLSAPAAAGFGVLGVFTSITGVLLVTELDLHDPVLTGAIIFLAFAASAVGQLFDHRLTTDVSLVAACVALIVGAGLIAAAVLLSSLTALVVAAVVAGLGAGSGFSAGLRAIGARVTPDHRGAAFSAYFAALYAALAVPAVGVGVVTEMAGLRWAGTSFAVVLALVAGLAVRTRPHAQQPVTAQSRR
jgi:hypothetical protein